MCVAKKSKLKLSPMFYNNEIVDQVTNFTHLGVTFSNTNKFYKGLNEVVYTTDIKIAGNIESAYFEAPI